MEMEEDVKTLKDYLQIIRRRKYIITVPMLILLASSAIAALILPPVYSSKATILIEQQHIPEDLLRSTVVSFADERIKQIEQKVMTVDNLNRIIDKFQLYPKLKNDLDTFNLATVFRENTHIELINADVIGKGKHSKATLAFKLSFDHKNAVITQKVVNELTTLFLDENIKSRTQRAQETTTFFEEEAEKFKLEIQKSENQIAEYKEKYSASLPELLPTNLTTINRIESEIQQLQLRESMLDERRISLRAQLAVTNPVVTGTDANNSTPENLPALKAEFDHLLSKYSSIHPDVKAIKKRIDDFEGAKDEKIGKANINNPVFLQLQGELDAAGIEINNINAQRNRLNEKLKQLEVNVAQTHQVERGYYELMRDLDNQKAKYNELKSKYLEAKLSQTLEEEQKSEKFTLLEPPRVPIKPEKPNRIKILFIGFVLSIGGGLAAGFMAEMMDDSIRGHKQLTSLTGIEPLVVIPYIPNQDDFNKERKNRINFSVIGLVLLIGMIVAIHFLYMPLDILWYKTWHRLGMF